MDYPSPPLAELVYGSDAVTGKLSPEPFAVRGALRVPIADYPDYREKYGLVLLHSFWVGPDFVLIVRPTIQPEEEPMDSQPLTKSPLAKILSRLLQNAIQRPGIPQRKDLKGGMRVDLLLQTGKVCLQISREKVYPSLTEWQTTLDYLPQKPQSIQAPTRFDQRGRYYLKTSWPHEEQDHA